MTATPRPVTGAPEPPRPLRLLVVVAHPADADDAIGGTVAGWVAAGTEARLVCCTSGDATGDDARSDPLELAAGREHGQREAAAVLGYAEVSFLHAPDGALANDLALREQLVRCIRTFRPDTMATCDPRVLLHASGRVNHVDHRTAGAAAIDAQPAAANAMAFSHLARVEDLPPHRVGRLLLFGTDDPGYLLDVSAAVELKARALRADPARDRGTVEPSPIEAFSIVELA